MQVPGIDNTPTISTNVPGVQFPMRGAAQAGEMISHAGEGLSRGVEAGAEVYDEVQRAHDISTAALAHTQDSVSESKSREQLVLNSPDGFVHDPFDGNIVTNRDGSQKTIAQQYWEDADIRYQDRQQNMTPRAAAMYRAKMQEVIGSNTMRLQNEGIIKQADSSEQKVQNVKDIYSKDFDRAFVPDVSAYYGGSQNEDGSVKQYPSAQKFFDAVQGTTLLREQLGNVQGKKGLFGAQEIPALKQSDAAELADHWLTSGKQDLIESSGSRAALHQNLKDAASTSVMQIHSMLDIVDGKDPESMRRAQSGLPTINSSLTPDLIHKWKNDLLGMIPAAKEVDKSEYELQKNQLDDFAKGVRSLDQFAGSALLQKTLLAGGGLGLTPAERVKDLSSAFSSAIMASAVTQTTGISSPESKRQAVAQVLQEGQKHWVQLAQMVGEHNTQGFAEAITAEASKQVAAKLQEDEHQMRQDPMKYMAGIKEGPQGPGGSPGYNNKTAHDIQNKLDPNTDPSLFSIFKPMPGGKSVIEAAQATANNGYARMFGAKADVAILQKNQFEDQAKRLVGSNDPRMITNYFSQLENQKGMTASEKEGYILDLVNKGGLPQTYADALNLKTSAEREARWASLQAGPPAMPEGLKDKDVEQYSRQENKSLFSFLDLKYGPNSPEARTARNTYDKSWQDDFKQGVNRGMSEGDAKNYANAQRDKTTGSIGVVGAKHDFFGTGWLHWGSTGPQVPVEFGSNKYTDQQQQNIKDTLLYHQSKENLSKYKFVTPPGALPPNDNAPSDAERIANTASMWRKVGGGWRLQTQELDKENRPTGISQDVQFYGADHKPRYFDVPEKQAIVGPPQGAAKAVAPATVLKNPIDRRIQNEMNRTMGK